MHRTVVSGIHPVCDGAAGQLSMVCISKVFGLSGLHVHTSCHHHCSSGPQCQTVFHLRDVQKENSGGQTDLRHPVFGFRGTDVYNVGGLFVKRQRKNEMYIIYNHEKNRIAAYEPEALPLSKTAVIQKSIFYFDDANPCYLHLNAVKVRLLEEIKK